MISRTTIDRLMEILQKAKIKQQELNKALDAVDEDVFAIEHTLNLLYLEGGIPSSKSSLSSIPDLLNIEGHTLSEKRREGFQAIARMNGGILIVKDSGQPMVAAGLFGDMKKFRTQAYTIIGAMDCWVKVDTGKYRLIETSAEMEPNGQTNPSQLDNALANSYNNPQDEQTKFATESTDS